MGLRYVAARQRREGQGGVRRRGDVRETRSERPRAVVGLTDPSARLYIGKLVGRGLMTFAVPFAMFRAMEANVPGSFLERNTWRALMTESPG